MDELVQLRGHYEVIFVQALDLLRLQRNRGVSPAKTDVGVMTFSFGQVASTLCEGKRLGEIFELEGSLDPPILIAHRPCGGLAALLVRLYLVEGYHHAGRAVSAPKRGARGIGLRGIVCRSSNRSRRDVQTLRRSSHNPESPIPYNFRTGHGRLGLQEVSY
jgi:hypothetical protein